MKQISQYNTSSVKISRENSRQIQEQAIPMHSMAQPMSCLKLPDQTVPGRNTVEFWLLSTSRMLVKLGI